MGECNMNMKKGIYVLLLGIMTIAELSMFFGQTFLGLGIHIINIITIIFILIFLPIRIEDKGVLQGLMLAGLIRVVNLSVPQFSTIELVQYSLIYGIMYIPIYVIIKNQNLSFKDLGIFRYKNVIVYFIVPIVSIIVAVIGFILLDPKPLVQTLEIRDIILISTVMFIFVAPVEEIIFKSMIQTNIGNVLGPKYGIIISGSLFGIIHASYGLAGEIIFAGMFGIITGYIFYKTKNLPIVIIIHGIVNVMIFSILFKVMA